MSTLFIWYLVKATTINYAFGFIACIAFIACIVTIVARLGLLHEEAECSSEYVKMHAVLKKGSRISIGALLFSGILTIVLPTTSELAVIVIAPKIVENKDVQETLKNFPELSRLATDWCKEVLKEQINKIPNASDVPLSQEDK